MIMLLLLLTPPLAGAGDLAVVSAPVFMELVNGPRHAPADWRSLSGAISMNQEWEKTKDGTWYVELQRDGGRWVQAGVAHRNRETIEWGLKQLQWGFAQMKPDGSFDCDDAFHSASFLVEATAHSIQLIEDSPFATDLQPQLGALKPPLLKAALWMISPTNFRAAENQRIYGHRRFLVGCGLWQCGLIHHHAELMQVAGYFIEDGIRMQRADGAFPEKGGHDSSYHAVSLIYLQRLLLTAPEEVRRPLWKDAAERGMRWLSGRIDDCGRVKVDGNTRTGSGQEIGRTGIIKSVNLPEVATALLYHSFITGDGASKDLARRVLENR
jgi:hypothetical protein